MSEAQKLIDGVAARGIKLSVQGDSIVIDPSRLLTDLDRTAILQHKPQILEILRPAVCWRCGAHRTPPSLDQQVETLREIHFQRIGPFRWPDDVWPRLREKLRPGDVLAICRGVIQVVSPFYDSAQVIREGKSILISRKELQSTE